MNIKSGDKVKYIGTAIPEYTGKILEVEKVIPLGYILLFPEKDRGLLGIEGFGVLKKESLICGFDEVEEQR
ncbi:hypothetical protein ACFJX1_11920 [Enterococcus faecalis]|nr:hypothetical protein [Enterococcus faecalis]EHA4047101.1 hypothetical protein [Enterococcus faecalis]EHN4295487.1 hypothetical protein [Enterococcus faecalis]EHN4654932.1 hypothetical protein [Enterococcus faecalis]EHQ9060449.1 hypothetical protein [Enterococcus faecalis]